MALATSPEAAEPTLWRQPCRSASRPFLASRLATASSGSGGATSATTGAAGAALETGGEAVLAVGSATAHEAHISRHPASRDLVDGRIWSRVRAVLANVKRIYTGFCPLNFCFSGLECVYVA